MAEIALAAVQTVLAALDFLEVKGIRSFWDYKSQIKDLKNTVDFIKCSLEDLQFKVLTKEGEHFTRQLKYVIYEADDLFDEFVTLLETGKLSDSDTFFDKVSSSFSYKALKMFNKVKKIRKKLDDIAANHHKFATVREYEPISFKGAQTCSHIDRKYVMIGRDKDKKAVLDKLLDPNNHNVGFLTIVGVGGLGKTALAQLVYNDEKLKKEFGNFMFWVCVSDQFDVKAILCEILELIRIQEKNRDNIVPNTKEAAQILFRQKMQGKKYFIVLDDVWNEDREKWLDLQSSLTSDEGESWVLVTTRSERTANLIEDGQTYKLQGLSPEDSWQLFQMMAFKKDTNQQSRMVEIGQKIVQKCSNIPLAIRVVGSLLYGQDIGRWVSFQHKELVEIDNGDNKVMSVLKLSYHKLSWSLKTCFSYCAVFPKDMNIKKELLINFWMTCGCIEPFHGRTMEEAAEEHFEILLQRCFFQDVEMNEYDEIKSFKIHDLMHDVAQEVGGEEFQVLGSVDDTLEDKTRHVSVNGEKCLVQSSFNLSNLRTLLIPDIGTQYRVAEHYIEKGKVGNWKSLRVLQLRYLYRGHRGRSLNSIVKLIHLRYLDLSGYGCEELPNSITKLHNLQVLILSGLRVRHLPHDFSKLVKLTHLNLAGCRGLRELPHDFSKLLKLTRLDLAGCGKLEQLPHDFGKLVKLTRLNLANCKKLRQLPHDFSELVKLTHLNLTDCGELKQWPHDFCELEDLCHLVVDGCHQGFIDMPLGLDRLKQLGVLTSLVGRIGIEIGENYKNVEVMKDMSGEYLSKIPGLKEVDIEMKGECTEPEAAEAALEMLEPHPNLKKLYLRWYGGRTIPWWRSAPIQQFNLVYIYIDRCDNLVTLPSFSKLPLLKTLNISDLKNLEYMETRNNLLEASDTAFFPSLETIYIFRCEKWRGWFREDGCGDADYGCLGKLRDPCLSNVYVSDCPKLTSFPPIQLFNLVYIHIGDCDNLVTLPSFSKLPLLKTLYISRLKNLEYMETRSNLLEASDTAFFPSLETIEIIMCEKWRGWFREDGCRDADYGCLGKLRFPCLSKVYVSDCPKLTSFPPCPSVKSITMVSKFRGGKMSQLLKKMTGKEEEDQREVTVDNHTSSSSCLANLHIQGDREMESLSEYEKVFETCASSLQELYIGGCDNLSRFSRGLEHLTALKLLKIWYMDTLDFSEDNNEDIMAWVPLQHSLHSLTFDSLCNMKSLPAGMKHLTSLQTLKLQYCNKLKELPEWMSSLSSLQSMTINNCHAIKSLPQGIQALTSLQTLNLQWCDELKELPEWISSLSSLQSLTIDRCHAIESLPQGIQTLTSLQTLKIDTHCDALVERCRKDNGEDWQKIKHIPNFQIVRRLML